MSKDQLFGAVLLVVGIVGIVVYAWLLVIFPTTVLQITAFIAVAFVLGIAAWIGWTMATTPPPAPLEPETPMPPAPGDTEPETKMQNRGEAT